MTQALLLGGLGAVVWGVGSMLSAPSSRILGVGGSVLWLSACAALAGAALALSISGPPHVAARDVPYLGRRAHASRCDAPVGAGHPAQRREPGNSDRRMR